MEDIRDMINKHFQALDDFMVLPDAPKADNRDQGWRWYESLRGIIKDAVVAGYRYGKMKGKTNENP